MTAALVQPSQRLTIEERATQLRAALDGARDLYSDALKPPVQLLYGLFLDWQRTDPKKATTRRGLKFGGYMSEFKNFIAPTKGGDFYRNMYAARAWFQDQTLPFVAFPYSSAEMYGPVDNWAVIGEALEEGWTPERIEGQLKEGGLESLRAALSGSESADGRQELEAARLRAATLNPDLPKQKKVQDVLNAQVVNLMPESWARAAYSAARGEQAGVDALKAVHDAARPISYYSWLKLRGRCFVCDLLPGEGEVMDLHHVAIGEKEARPNDDSPEVMVAAHRECHIPQPFSSRATAHSHSHSVGNDAERLVRVIRYNAIHLSAYQSAIGAAA